MKIAQEHRRAQVGHLADQVRLDGFDVTAYPADAVEGADDPASERFLAVVAGLIVSVLARGPKSDLDEITFRNGRAYNPNWTVSNSESDGVFIQDGRH